MISDGLIQLIDERAGRQEGRQGCRRSWKQCCLGQERTAEGREGGREGAGRCVAVCYSSMELAARNLVCVYVNVCKHRNEQEETRAF